MIVEIEKLKNVAVKLINHIEYLQRISISVDYYWNINPSERADPYSEPKNFTLGQLSDDWTELEKILTDETEPVGYGLVWLSSIIRQIGEQYPG